MNKLLYVEICFNLQGQRVDIGLVTSSFGDLVTAYSEPMISDSKV